MSRLCLLGVPSAELHLAATAMKQSRRMEPDQPISLSGERYEGRHVSAVSAWSTGRLFRLGS